MITGNRGAYRWIVWNSQFLRELVSAVPEIVVGKFAVITSLDSGPFIPSEDEVRRGWELKRGLAYSPKVLRADDLPHDQFDEWFVFSSRKEIDPPEVFVNYGGFRLRYYTADIETHSLLERFWRQMEILQPESYLAEGDFLILVTRNISLYEEGLDGIFPGRKRIALAAIQPEKGIIKRIIPLVIFTILLFLSGCRKINRPQATFAAGPTAETAGSSAIEPDQDVRFGDLSRLAMTLDRALLLTLTFHESNVWPDHYGAIAWEILGPGKNPG